MTGALVTDLICVATAPPRLATDRRHIYADPSDRMAYVSEFINGWSPQKPVQGNSAEQIDPENFLASRDLFTVRRIFNIYQKVGYICDFI